MHSNRGEIGVVALLVGISAALIGTFLSVVSPINLQNVNIKASEPTCLYHAEAQVVKEDTSILPISENGDTNYGVSNNEQLEKNSNIPAGPFGLLDDNNNQINEYYENLSIFTYHHDNLNLTDEEKNKTTDVTLLGLDLNKWKIIGQFCQSLRRDNIGCPDNLDSNNTNNKINGFKKSCGVHIKYGWVVAPNNDDNPEKCEFESDSCKPKNPKISFSGSNRVRVEWDIPETCPNLTQLEDKIQIDIKDENDEIICSKNVDVNNDDTGTDCKLERDIIRNTQRPKKLENGQYKAYVRVASENGSCLSPDSIVTGSYQETVEPTEEPVPPTNTPIPEKCESIGQYCTDDYTEDCKTNDGRQGKKQCHKEGNCSGVGDLTKCGWDDDKSFCGSCIANDDNNNPLPDPTSDHCRTVIGSGPNRVLFIPYNFSSSNEFAPYVAQAIENMRHSNLGDLYNQFTFVAYDFFYNPWNGQYGCSNPTYRNSRIIKCIDVEAIKATFSKCNINTAGLVIAKLEGKYNYSAGAQVASIGYLSAQYASHELGHAIARLGDEYSFNMPSNSQSNKPNCSSSRSCPWSGPCIAICGYTNWFRPSDKSAMNQGSLWSSDFNSPSLEAWSRSLGGGRSSRLASMMQATANNDRYNQTLYLKVRQNQRGELALEDIQIKNSYPVELENGLTKDYFSLKMIDSEINTLYTGQFASKNTVYSEPQPPTEVLREIIELHLPYYDNLASVEIYNTDGQKKLDVDLDEFELPIPTPRENLCGNGVCDSALGENQNSCEVDCKPNNDYRDRYKELSSDINQDGSVNTLDCSVCLQQYKKASSSMSCDIINDREINALDYTTCLNNLGKQVEHAPELSDDTDPTPEQDEDIQL